MSTTTAAWDGEDILYDLTHVNPLGNSTTSDPESAQDSWVHVTYATILVVICLASVFCNGVVLLTLLRTRRLRTLNSMYLANMAAVDLTIGMFVMPIAISHSIMLVHEVDDTFCTITAFIWSVLSKSCVLTVAAMAIDRYHAIINCLRYTTAKRYHYAVCSMIWVWLQAILFSIPPLVGWGEYNYMPNRYLCTVDWSVSWTYTTASFTLCYLLPLAIVILCYIRVLHTARGHVKRISETERQRERLQSICVTNGHGGSEDPTPEAVRKARSVSSNSMLAYAVVDPVHRVSLFPSIPQWGNNLMRRNLYIHTGIRDLYNIDSESISIAEGAGGDLGSHYRATVRLVTQVMVLIVIWCPLFLATLVQVGGIMISGSILTAFTWVSFSGSCTNPLIYALGSRRFRLAVKNVWSGGKGSKNARKKRDDVANRIANLYHNRKTSSDSALSQQSCASAPCVNQHSVQLPANFRSESLKKRTDSCGSLTRYMRRSVGCGNDTYTRTQVMPLRPRSYVNEALVLDSPLMERKDSGVQDLHDFTPRGNSLADADDDAPYAMANKGRVATSHVNNKRAKETDSGDQDSLSRNGSVTDSGVFTQRRYSL